MKIKFHSHQILDGKEYAAGEAVVSDALALTAELKKLIHAGHVSIVPRTEAEQKVQAGKDAHAAKKASMSAPGAQVEAQAEPEHKEEE